MFEYKYLLAGLMLSVTAFLIIPLIVFTVTMLINKEARLNINFKIVFVEIILFTIIFGFSYWFVFEKLKTEFWIIITFVFCFLVLPSYHFLIAPIWYLANNNMAEKSIELSNFLRIHGYTQYKVLFLKEKNLINAYATGILPFSTLILVGKDLEQKLKQIDVKSILFHEVGHHEKKHLIKLFAINSVLSVVSYFLFYLRSIIIHPYEGILQPISVFITGCLIGFLVIYTSGRFQRIYEYEADLFAAKKVGVENYIRALKSLDKITDGGVSKGGFTHPTLEKRIQHLSENCY